MEAGRYIVVPCTFDPAHEASFELKVLSDNFDVHAYEMGERKGTVLAGEWRGESAGGCMYVSIVIILTSNNDYQSKGILPHGERTLIISYM